MIHYDEPLIRPPSEARSLILQATLGCSHNRCAFCVTYQGKAFRPRPAAELAREIDWAGRHLPHTRRVFLADGDALALGTDRLLEILDRLRRALPGLGRVSAYATPLNLRHKSVAELERLRRAGLTLLYTGIESGDAEILDRIDKGVAPEEMAALCARAAAAGMKLSATVVLGLGGPRLSRRHALATAALVDRVKPRYLSALTLMLPPREPSYARAFGDPAWRLLEPVEMVRELRLLVASITAGGIIFRANHASNHLALAGTLPKDRKGMLARIDSALADEEGPGFRPDWLRGL
jgi:radical SAM superfamily enzyme YgiQ (UPF0313 family)